jgi:hypothetical protein
VLTGLLEVGDSDTTYGKRRREKKRRREREYIPNPPVKLLHE